MSENIADASLLLLWLVWCGLLGACVVSLFWPRRLLRQQPRLWLAAMSVTAGLAFSSIAHMAWLAVETGLGPWAADALLACALVPAGALCWFMRRKRREGGGAPLTVSLDAVEADGPTWWRWAAIASVLAMLAGTTARILESPHGEFDAISIWNARARFFFRAPDHWRDAFATAVHADYPLMLPLNTARAWWVVGHETLLAPAALALLYALILIAAVWGATHLLAGTRRAALAVLLLTASPLLALQASFEYADVPLACCVASAAGLAMLSLRLRVVGRDASSSAEALGLIALCGMCCGCAAWLKNEGQLITLSAAVATALVHPGPLAASLEGRFKRLAAFAAGAAPPMLVVLAVRKSIGHTSDLLADRTPDQVLALAVEPARHFGILAESARELLLDFPDSLGLWLALAAAACLLPAVRRPTFLAPASRWIIVFATLVAAGYYVVYLFTPFDIEWHVRFSVTRLFMHVWPALVMLIVTAGPMIENQQPPSRGL